MSEQGDRNCRSCRSIAKLYKSRLAANHSCDWSDLELTQNQQSTKPSNPLPQTHNLTQASVSSRSIQAQLIPLGHKMAPPPPPPPKTILVIGGGLGGLAFAQILQNSSVADKYKTIVFERDPSAGERPQGYRIGITRSGQSALSSVPNAAQFLEAIKPKPKGALMVDSKLKFMMSIKDDPSNPDASIVGVVNRWALHDTLVPGVSVEYGKTFDRYEETETNVVAYFKDGTQATGDMLVGADGAKSRVRTQRCPDLKLEDVAVQVVAASVAATPSLKAKMPRLVELLQGSHFVRGLGAKGSCLMLMEFEGASGSEMFFWAYSFPLHVAPNLPAETLKPEIDALAGEIFKAEGAEYASLVQETPAEGYGLLARTLAWVVPTNKNLSPLGKTTRVTLLGDAAHAMTPHRGIGANVAFQDASDLVEALKHEDADAIMTGIPDYEKLLFNRGFKASRLSKQATDMLHGTGWRGVLRDTVLKGVGWVNSSRTWAGI